MVSGVHIRKTQMKGNLLVLDGERYGLRVKGKTVQPVQLNHVHLEIAAPDSGDFNQRLDEILVPDVRHLLPMIPQQLQRAARLLFLAGSPQSGTIPLPPLDPRPPAYQVGGQVVAPKLKRQVDPQMSDAASRLKLGGSVLLHLDVEQDGRSGHVEVTQLAGLGLDEQAVIAVSQYLFEPGTLQGQPVVVELNVAVDFSF